MTFLEFVEEVIGAKTALIIANLLVLVIVWGIFALAMRDNDTNLPLQEQGQKQTIATVSPKVEDEKDFVISKDQADTWSSISVYAVTDKKTGKRYMVVKGSSSSSGISVIELGQVRAEKESNNGQ